MKSKILIFMAATMMYAAPSFGQTSKESHDAALQCLINRGGMDYKACIDAIPIQTEESIAREKKEKEDLEMERLLAKADKMESDRIKNLESTKAGIKDLSQDQLCLGLRDANIIENDADLSAIFKAEITRRKIPYKASSIKSQKFSVGDSLCTMLISMGKPKRVNRTVTQNRVHIQYVFDYGTYIYTTNGVVTSWQD